jgi:ADP-L-glycero-D-manno-heptose 6-epimerase
LQQELGADLGTDYIPNPYAGYQMHTQADISTSKTGLGFEPKISITCTGASGDILSQVPHK